MDMKKPTLLVSHKGAWLDHRYPQNSLPALQQAVQNGFGGLEFDVRRTADGHFVLAHDDEITRLSNGRGRISGLSLAELQGLRVTKNTLLPITQVLLKAVSRPQPFTALSEVAESLFFDDRVRFVWIDVKEQSDAAVAAVQRFFSVFGRDPVLKKIVINNGSPAVLRQLKACLPGLRYSLEGRWGSEPLTDLRTYLGQAGITHDAVSLNVGLFLGHEPAYRLLNRKKRFWHYLDSYLAQARQARVPTIGWTVNRSADLHRLRHLHLDYLLTDRLFPA